MSLYLLIKPLMDPAEEKETSNLLAQGSAITILVMSVLAWFVAWRFLKIEPKGKKIYFINLVIALMYLPFLVRFFFISYAMNFHTGKEHYLMIFFVHSAIFLFISVGFYGRHKQEESF